MIEEIKEKNRPKYFEWFEEEIFRMLRKNYQKVKYQLSWTEFYTKWEEQVKEDALRLRQL